MPHVSNDVFLECNGGDEVTLGENITQVEQHSEATTPISGETPSDPSLPTVQLHISPSQRSSSLLHQVSTIFLLQILFDSFML